MDQVIQDNMNLIYAISGYFRNYKSKEDLIQAGTLGLLQAYKKYNPDMGVKFSTYAYTYILGEMIKLVRTDKGIKVSREISSINREVEEARNKLEQLLGREPSISEISTYINKDECLVSEAILSVNCLQSLDYVMNDDENKGITLHDVIGDNLDIDMVLELREQLDLLDPMERRLILARYVNDFTQAKTANILGMNQVQVSRTEKKILMKMRKNLINV